MSTLPMWSVLSPLAPLLSSALRLGTLALLGAALVVCGPARPGAGRAVAAEPAYFQVRLGDLRLVEGRLPAPDRPPTSDPLPFERLTQADLAFPYAWLDQPGEAVLRPPTSEPQRTLVPADWTLHVRSDFDGDLTGRLFFPGSIDDPAKPLRFRLTKGDANPNARVPFLQARRRHYDRLAAMELPGAAWFRRQAAQAARELAAATGESAGGAATPFDRGGRPRRPEASGPTFDLFSGRRAISENLALDWQMPDVQIDRSETPVDSLTGISTPPVDWKPLLPPAATPVDRLTELLPADQHAILLPSFAALEQLRRRAAGLLGPALTSTGSFGPGLELIPRYERQLGVSLDGPAAKLAAGLLVKSIAITGGDLYLELGTDLAIVFETDRPAELRDALTVAQGAALSKVPGSSAVRGKIGDTDYSGYASADRRASGYVATLPGAVVLTNSLRQIERLDAVRRTPDQSLGKLDEYRFFRHRYPVGRPDETAFLFLSDATIRRWCGPRWRIGMQRRTRALAELADLQATYADRLLAGVAEPVALPADASRLDLGRLALESGGVRSSTFNTVEFATPIGELPLDQVSKSEADAYEQWRQRYEMNWRWAFDPIGLSISDDDRRLRLDLTVLPLIANSNYRDLIRLVAGARLEGAVDPHPTLLRADFAVRRDDALLRSLEGGLVQVAKVELLSWIGPTITVYFDDSPKLEELRRMAREGRTTSGGGLPPGLFKELPIALQVSVADAAGAKTNLKRLRTWAEPLLKIYAQIADREYRGAPYVQLAVTEEGARILGQDASLYIATLDDCVLFTPAESTLRAAVDRRLQAAPPQIAPREWAAGRNATLEVERGLLELAGRTFDSDSLRRLQRRSWSRLAILNEWRRLHPQRDPVEDLRRLWQVDMSCPAGGRFVWNEALASYESTAAGHPAAPRTPATPPSAFDAFERVRFALQFENGGLRVESQLDWRTPP